MEVELTGLDEALQRLNRLNISEEIENKALIKAGKVTQEAIIAEANFGNRSEGTMKKNIKLKRPKNGEVTIHTGGAFHAHLIEFGRSAGSIVLRNGRRVTWGATAPNPFFGRGYEQSKANAMNAMIDEIQRELGL